ncbi:hypothetical protein B296_00008223 [Ensete ventricosum]|uniref:Uncharacterized protein n=1 Tax=Ensete ventricosum TaxID=4639 RepID=A0A426ZA81_ENSVE|nr:hypothetical protein B296_00008223 [Ensete ventricosum]
MKNVASPLTRSHLNDARVSCCRSAGPEVDPRAGGLPLTISMDTSRFGAQHCSLLDSQQHRQQTSPSPFHPTVKGFGEAPVSSSYRRDEASMTPLLAW